MVTYAKHVSTRQTPQSEPIPGKSQVENSAGGFSFAVDCWARLDRFLILGSEGGSYYATERKLTQENATAIRQCADLDAKRTVQRIVEISQAGRAPKNDQAVFSLAMLAGHAAAKGHALAALSDVCRIGTHLFQYVEQAQKFRGWGRALRHAVAEWYTSKTPQDLSYQLTKYQQRGGWSHRDVLRKCHAHSDDMATNMALGWAARPYQGPRLLSNDMFQFLYSDKLARIAAFEMAKRATSEAEIVRLIREYDMVRECIPTEYLNSPAVWESLLEKMPMTAMIRNLGKMSAIGLLKPMSTACQVVAERLADKDRLVKARIHPLSILLALSVYRNGKGVKGSLTWSPDSAIVDALDAAFYLAFESVVPTGKRHLLALDVSGSMTWDTIAGTFLTPRDGAAAMAMVMNKLEPITHTTAFSMGISPVSLSKNSRLDNAVRTINSLRAGGTDCALPMLYALENRIEADVFVVYTDSETWAGNVHPCQALQQYRDKMGIPAKLIVCGMVSNGFTIADPNDSGMLDVVGFDSSVPTVMSDFARS